MLIVVAITGDLVSVGHAESLAHPGGNVTGLVDISAELSAKRLQLVTELLPDATRIGILWNETNQVKVLDFEVIKRPLSTSASRSSRCRSENHADGVLVLSTPLFIGGARRLAELAMTHKLPTICSGPETTPRPGDS